MEMQKTLLNNCFSPLVLPVPWAPFLSPVFWSSNRAGSTSWEQSHRHRSTRAPWEVKGARGIIPSFSCPSLLIKPLSSALLSTQAMPRILIFNPDVLWNGFGPGIHFATLSARQAETCPHSFVSNVPARRWQGQEAEKSTKVQQQGLVTWWGYLLAQGQHRQTHRAGLGLGQQRCAALTKLAEASPSQGENQTSHRPDSEVSRTQEFDLSIVSIGYYSHSFASGHTQK